MSFSSWIIVDMALYYYELCPLLMKNHAFDDVLSLYQINLIRTVSNIFTMLSTKMSFPSSNIVIFLQELLPFVHESLPLIAMFTL